MRVVLSGLSGQFQTKWFGMQRPPRRATFMGRNYIYAGTQDGAWFYREDNE